MDLKWLHGRIVRWCSPVLLAALALVFDEVDRRTPFSILGTGFLDEPAHAALAGLGLLVVAGVARFPAQFYVAAMIMSVMIDLDHVPIYLGDDNIVVGANGRPFTHSLATVVVAVALAVLVKRWRYAFAGAAVGLLLHLARDIAEGGATVPLLWPLSDTGYAVSPLVFRATVAVLFTARLAQLGIAQVRRRNATGDTADVRNVESTQQEHV